jgi:hypothetical protein
MIASKHFFSALAVVSLASGFNSSAHAAPKHAPAGRYHEAHALMGGFLLRASMVCGDKYGWKAMASAGLGLLAGEMRPITQRTRRARIFSLGETSRGREDGSTMGTLV